MDGRPVEMKGGTESEKDISGYCLCSRFSFDNSHYVVYRFF